MDLCSVRTLRKDLKATLDHPSCTIVGDPHATRAIIVPMPGRGGYKQQVTKQAIDHAQHLFNAQMAELRNLPWLRPRTN